MTDLPAIKRRPDGSIDTEYHIRQGRAARSRAAHRMLAPSPPAPRRRPAPSFRLAALFGALLA